MEVIREQNQRSLITFMVNYSFLLSFAVLLNKTVLFLLPVKSVGMKHWTLVHQLFCLVEFRPVGCQDTIGPLIY